MAKASSRSRHPILLWGATIGFGLGAIIDVILFHLVFQHHHLLSGNIDPDSYAGLRENVFYDGVFLLLMVGVMLAGLGMLWRTANGRSVRHSSTYLGGAVLIGIGVFNSFDGIVDHYVLGLHDVVHGSPSWNPHWILVSVLILGTGIAIVYTFDSVTDSTRKVEQSD